jgi:hypothetical protein
MSEPDLNFPMNAETVDMVALKAKLDAEARPKIVSIASTPSGIFALMDDGRLFERVVDNKNFDTTGRAGVRWLWVEREGPLSEPKEP